MISQLVWCLLGVAVLWTPSEALNFRRSRGASFRKAFTAKEYLKTQGHDVDVEMVCKEPFGPSGQTCYLVSPEPMKFEDADKFCASADSRLVEPSTEAKMEEVRRFLNAREDTGDVWVAGQKKSGKWIWTGSGSKFQETFWSSGQPAGTWKIWAPKDFLKLSSRDNYDWKTEANGEQLHVLCEQNDPLLAAACPDGTIFRGQCYTISHEKKSWLGAREQCESKNGDIVMVDKRPVYKFLESKLYQIFGEPISNTIWTFEYKVASGFWINIWKKVTRLFGAGEECSLFDRDTGDVSIVDCGTKHPYVCVFDDRAKFPVNCIEHEGKCYSVYAEPKPARDAELACQGINAERLKITEEAQEVTILKDLFQEGNGTPERGLWLDSHVEGGGQEQKVGLSRLFDKLFYLHIERGTGPDAECNVLNHDRGSIDSRTCNEKHYFACEYGVQDDPYAVAQINEEARVLEARIEKANGAFLHKVKDVNEKDGEKDLYQVDIRLTPKQRALIHGEDLPEVDQVHPTVGQITTELYAEWLRHHHKRNRRNAVSNPSYLWPLGQIPFFFPESAYSRVETDLILSAMSEISSQTCLEFVPRTTENDYLVINNTGRGCYSYVGLIGGAQELSLSSACISSTSVGTIQHEIMHALGIYHEQARYDRDEWVSVNMGNVAEGYEVNFEKIPSYMMTTQDLPYDYNSVMHYPENAFAKDNTVPTIIPLQPDALIGQRNGPSTMDYLEINKLYKCQLPEDGGWDFWSEWSPCTTTCGQGQRSRSRTCTRPSPSNGGKECVGDSQQSDACMNEPCPSLFHGHVYLGCWNDHVLPSLLETLEGKGISHLSEPYPERSDSVKKCADAAREKGYTIFALRLGGKCFAQTENDDPLEYKSGGPSDACKGGTGEIDAIDVYRLGSGAVDGDYGPWKVFARCSVSCGTGERVLTRTCTNPAPSLLGKACEGDASMTETCNTNSCPVDGGWSEWGLWSNCSMHCGDDGFETRTRSCDDPEPLHGGMTCGNINYDGVEIRECNRFPCTAATESVSSETTTELSESNSKFAEPSLSFPMDEETNGIVSGQPSSLHVQGEVTLTSDGRDGNGLLFEGGSVSYPEPTCLNNPSECPDGFTVSLFLKTDIGHIRSKDRPTYVFTSGVQSEEVETDNHLGLAIYFRQDGMLKATLRTNTTEGTVDLPSVLFSDPTRFYHVAVTYSPDVFLTVYYQGQPIDNDVSGRPNENLDKPSRDTFLLGKSFGIDGHRFNGTMDELNVWFKAQSRDTVYEIFKSAPHSCVDCDLNSQCGPETCVCNSGYIGDGFVCQKQPVNHGSTAHPLPVIYESLDEDSRPEVQDTTGKISSALSFDGRRDWLDLGNFTGECLSFPDACVDGLTVSFWLRYFGRGERPNYILSSAAQGHATGLDIFVHDDAMNVTIQTTSRQYTVVLPTKPNRWVQCTVVWKNTTGLQVYVNGEPTPEEARTKSVQLTESDHTGFRLAQPNNCFVLNGRFVMDDFVVWLQDLSPEDVRYYFTAGVGSAASQLE